MPSESNLGEANRGKRKNQPKFSLAGEGVAARKSLTREWKTRGKAESRKKKVEIAKSRTAVLSTPSATLSVARPSSKRDNYIAYTTYLLATPHEYKYQQTKQKIIMQP